MNDSKSLGIDVDYEDTTAFNGGTGSGETWLIDFTTQLRTLIPSGSYIITHAPLAPWFAPDIWGGGGYLKVHESVGDLIDWYNVQVCNFALMIYERLLTCFANSSTTVRTTSTTNHQLAHIYSFSPTEGASEYTTVRLLA